MTESQSGEGANDGFHMESAQAGPHSEGQGETTTPPHPGLQLQLGGPAQTATVPIHPYSGFDEALKRWGQSNDTIITQDCKWQRDIDGDTHKIKQFQDVVGGLQDFRTHS